MALPWWRIHADFSRWLPCPLCAWKWFLWLVAPSSSWRSRLGWLVCSVLVLLLDLCDDRTDGCFTPVLSHPFQLPSLFKDIKSSLVPTFASLLSTLRCISASLMKFKYFLTWFSSARGLCFNTWSTGRSTAWQSSGSCNYLSRHIFEVSETRTV